jgi:competence transcription factor ComK
MRSQTSIVSALLCCAGFVTMQGAYAARPVISGTAPTTATVGTPYYFKPAASDADGDKLWFSIQNKPSWATFSNTTGELTGTPTGSGSYTNIVIAASDRTLSGVLPAFSITVSAASTNQPPVISGTPPTSAVAGKAYYFKPTASDPNGDTLWFSIQNKPAWASFSNTTGELTGTPTTSGSYANIIIAASDRSTSAFLPAFSVAVSTATTTATGNRVPTISGTPPTSAVAGQAYYFKPTASDADGDSLWFSIQNKPAWASFSNTTGELTGTPTTTGTYANIIIAASDRSTSAFLPTFSVSVGTSTQTTTTTGNRVPTISGTPPATATAGQAYYFKPTASDADGDSLWFSIQNKPDWASFSNTTGELTGTPAASGTYGNIIIAASDRSTSAFLPTFSVIVNGGSSTPPVTATASGAGTVALAWTPPTQNIDGSPIELGGYKIYYGTSAGALTKSVFVNNPAISAYVVENLAPGTYYFAMKTVTLYGVESDFSSSFGKAVN